jgi:hypothetical protein
MVKTKNPVSAKTITAKSKTEDFYELSIIHTNNNGVANFQARVVRLQLEYPLFGWNSKKSQRRYCRPNRKGKVKERVN